MADIQMDQAESQGHFSILTKIGKGFVHCTNKRDVAVTAVVYTAGAVTGTLVLQRTGLTVSRNQANLC